MSENFTIVQKAEAEQRYINAALRFEEAVDAFVPHLNSLLGAMEGNVAVGHVADGFGIFDNGGLMGLLSTKVAKISGRSIDAGPIPDQDVQFDELVVQDPTAIAAKSVVEPTTNVANKMRTSPGYVKLKVYNTVPDADNTARSQMWLVRETGLTLSQIQSAVSDLNRVGLIEVVGPARAGRYKLNGERVAITQKEISQIGAMNIRGERWPGK